MHRLLLLLIAILPLVIPKESSATPTTNKSPVVLTYKPSPAIRPVLTPAEWQKLQNARLAAMKADPDLVTQSQHLSTKMDAFQAKLDAAMIKTDPKITPILAKLSNFQPKPAGTPPLTQVRSISSPKPAELPPSYRSGP